MKKDEIYRVELEEIKEALALWLPRKIDNLPQTRQLIDKINLYVVPNAKDSTVSGETLVKYGTAEWSEMLKREGYTVYAEIKLENVDMGEISLIGNKEQMPSEDENKKEQTLGRAMGIDAFYQFKTLWESKPEIIKNMRNGNGETQRYLSNKIGVSVSTIDELERGKNPEHRNTNALRQIYKYYFHLNSDVNNG